MATVFLSHASVDKLFVRQVAADLQASDVSVWIDERELVPGASLVGGLSEGLRSADYVLLFVSGAFLRSRWTEVETNVALRTAIEQRKASVIPLLLEDVWNSVSPLLRDLIYVDFRGAENILAYRQALSRVLSAVSTRQTMDLPATTRKPTVLVSGGRSETGGSKGLKIAHKLGRLLVSRACPLLTGVAEGIDATFAAGVAEEAEGRNLNVRDILTAYSRRGHRTHHNFGRILQSRYRTREEGIPELVSRADVAFLIGGGKNTMFLGVLMLLEGKVVLPIAATGGAAEDCHALILSRYERVFHGSIPRTRFEDLGDQNLRSSEMATVCAELLDLVVGRSTAT